MDWKLKTHKKGYLILSNTNRGNFKQEESYLRRLITGLYSNIDDHKERLQYLEKQLNDYKDSGTHTEVLHDLLIKETKAMNVCYDKLRKVEKELKAEESKNHALFWYYEQRKLILRCLQKQDIITIDPPMEHELTVNTLKASSPFGGGMKTTSTYTYNEINEFANK